MLWLKAISPAKHIQVRDSSFLGSSLRRVVILSFQKSPVSSTMTRKLLPLLITCSLSPKFTSCAIRRNKIYFNTKGKNSYLRHPFLLKPPGTRHSHSFQALGSPKGIQFGLRNIELSFPQHSPQSNWTPGIKPRWHVPD